MPAPNWTKRNLLRTGAAALATALPHGARAAERPMTVVLESEVVILDPHMTTAAITRTFGYHVFDTLFAMDLAGAIQPQMVDTYTTSPDGLLWRFTLRDGLAWHDGAPVTAADCVASLQRWAPKDGLGRLLAAATLSMEAVDARSFTITLKTPLPLMLALLGKPTAPLPVMMPARILPKTADARITEIIGSGPFTFRAADWRPGDRMVLARNAAYRPRPEKSDFLAGGKVVHIDQIVLKVMPDDATGATALVAGEIDYMQYLPFDWLGKLEKTQDVRLMTLTGIDMFQGNFRLNHATGPFADPAVRRVLWHLVDQAETLQAIGIPDRFAVKNCPSFFLCDAPYSSTQGSEAAKLSIATARAELAKTAYKGEPVILMETSGSISQTAGTLLAQNMRAAGFTVEEQAMDWGTVLARRAKKDGWSLFAVYSNGIDMISPLTHFYIANNCSDYPGFSCSATLTGLLADFVKAPDQPTRKQIAAAIQAEAYQLVPTVMWGQFARPAGYRNRLRNLVQSSFPIFWQVELATA